MAVKNHQRGSVSAAYAAVDFYYHKKKKKCKEICFKGKKGVKKRKEFFFKVFVCCRFRLFLNFIFRCGRHAERKKIRADRDIESIVSLFFHQQQQQQHTKNLCLLLLY
jgi:hypothetical protein